MRRVLVVLALASIAVVYTPTAAALGFGRTGTTSVLGQPLDFSAVLLLDPDESIGPECVSAEVLAGDNRLAASKLRLRLDGAPRGPRVTVHLRTTVRIVEPVVTIHLSAGCGARLSRSFVAFIEPARRGRDVPVNVVAAAPLRDAVQPVAAPVEVVASAPTTADADSLQHERDRSLALEQALSRAQADNAAARQESATLQSRLREAEAARRDPPLVYGLATLVVLLLAAIGALLWRLSRLRPLAASDTAPEATSAHAAEPAPALKASPLDHTWTQTRVITEPYSSGPSPLDPAQSPITTLPATHSATPELSVEEVLDLEQQADFLIALAQDEAAIDLLMAHLRSSGGASAMPYLKLLDIYRRRDDLDAHERIRQRFSRRFNAHAPAIAADPAAGQSLVAYPPVIAKLQAAWASTEAAVALLESLMGRTDSGDPGFDLPAFADLMLLHAIARDLREREVGEGGVDVLLPLAGQLRVISGGLAPTIQLDLQLP